MHFFGHGYRLQSIKENNISGRNISKENSSELRLTGSISLQPFVLRELEQHIQAMHYVGIEGPVVEQMEARLKDDIEAEARKNEGRVLLHREEARSNVRLVCWSSKKPLQECIRTGHK